MFSLLFSYVRLSSCLLAFDFVQPRSGSGVETRADGVSTTAGLVSFKFFVDASKPLARSFVRSTVTVRTVQLPIILWTATQNSGHLAAST